MQLTINHQKKFFDPPLSTLKELLELENFPLDSAMAVALNHKVIPRAQWPVCLLQANDQILIITPTQGG